MTAGPPLVELVGVTKRFGSFVANDGISFEVRPGTVHALLGENGAGKSTLVKCLMGYHPADEGRIVVDKVSRQIRGPADAHRLGIGMVYQHFTLIPAMSVAENFLLARPDVPGLVRWPAELARMSAFLERAPFQVDLNAPVTSLAAGQKQKVEILKQLYLQSRLLILDEPTSVLTPVEADEVLGRLRQMADAKQISVLLITHKLREVAKYADEVTVLRRGRVTGRGPAKGLDASALAVMMVGERPPKEAVVEAAPVGGATVLEVDQLRAARDNGVEALHGITLKVNAGEILGVAGVSGNGQRELVEVLGGQRPPAGGSVRVNGKAYRPSRRQMVANGVHVLPEEPLRNACAPAMSVAENLAMRTFDRPPLARWGWLSNQGQIRANGRAWMQRFDVKASSETLPISQLSGGNVQRAVLARELGPGNAKLLVVANPCFGLDIAAVEFIHEGLLKARNHGAAVLLVSEDLDELMALSDRIVVLAGGEIVHEAARGNYDLKVIGGKMAGLA
ncbi:MAG TPA: ABC transporter ATP-binding protein [Chthoniobacterales bacterium]